VKLEECQKLVDVNACLIEDAFEGATGNGGMGGDDAGAGAVGEFGVAALAAFILEAFLGERVCDFARAEDGIFAAHYAGMAASTVVTKTGWARVADAATCGSSS